ncbi:hypothetical protein DMC30DRAFT_247004 [Rhodotorula diobovata]|uniref:Proteophosphoglycan ppg4 n=1 Tax=Rhodotorula diobovata TaxID=5288 RepID=A0A5C5FV43_9BASI|nr:hypothetical protein DMC30DRAFT_247004 [Rhodotorula diobovata]
MGPAQRLLYQKVAVGGDVDVEGTVEHTLLHQPRLRLLVKSVEYCREGRSLLPLGLVTLLCDLPNVGEVSWSSLFDVEPPRLLFAQRGIRLRQISAPSWGAELASLAATYPDAFSSLEHVEVGNIGIDDDFAFPLPAFLPRLRKLGVGMFRSERDFEVLAGHLQHQLVSLSLPLDWELDGISLTGMSELRHLRLTVQADIEREDVGRIVLAVLGVLDSARAVGALTSLSIERGTCLLGLAPSPDIASREPVPSFCSLLFAIPPQIEHLSLDTSCFLASDVAAFLLSPLRPSKLCTLRIGDTVGSGLTEILGDSTGPCGALADTLERAGIEVTTIGW